MQLEAEILKMGAILSEYAVLQKTERTAVFEESAWDFSQTGFLRCESQYEDRCFLPQWQAINTSESYDVT